MPAFGSLGVYAVCVRFPCHQPGGKAGVPRGPVPTALRGSASGLDPQTAGKGRGLHAVSCKQPPEGCQHSRLTPTETLRPAKSSFRPGPPVPEPVSQLCHWWASSQLGDAPSSRGPRSPSTGTPTVLLNVWLPALWAFIFLRLLTKVCSLWWYSAVLYVFWC